MFELAFPIVVFDYCRPQVAQFVVHCLIDLVFAPFLSFI